MQHEPGGGFTANFIVCMILNKHLPANDCVLKYEAYTHHSMFPWNLAMGNAVKRINKFVSCGFSCQKLRVIVS